MPVNRTQEVAFNTLRTGSKAVSSAGTAESLTSTDTYTRRVIIRGNHDNTGTVYIGDSTVTNSGGANPGYPLLAGESTAPMPIDNLKNIFVDADTSADSIDFMYFHNT